MSMSELYVIFPPLIHCIHVYTYTDIVADDVQIGNCYNMGKQSKMHLKFKCHELEFAYIVLLNCQTGLKSWTAVSRLTVT